MDKILPRKYNNPVTIGLGVALIVALGVILYMYYNQQGSVAASQEKYKSIQQTVRPEEVETILDGGAPALVLFWSEGCGHCTAFKPDWDKAAAVLNSSGQVDVLDFEPSKNGPIISAAQTKLEYFGGVPDVRFFPDGFGLEKKSIKFNGPRTEEALLKFVYTNQG